MTTSFPSSSPSPSAETTDPRQAGPQPPFDEPSQSLPGRETELHQKPDHGEATYRGHQRLEGKVALITGGDSGIGRAIALAFAREGADVAINYLPAEEHDAKETATLVEEAGRRILLFPGDLAEVSVCEGVVKKTSEGLGRIDILVNNAGHQDRAVERFNDLSPERILRTFEVNIIAMFHTCRAAFKYMKSGGAIINTASVQAYKPSAAILDYAATKGAIVAFTKGLAEEALKHGIRINCVAPGPVWTPLIAQSFSGEKLRNFGKHSPMGRPAQPAELAPAYVFLASDESRYVNGEVLGVTGGMPLG